MILTPPLKRYLKCERKARAIFFGCCCQYYIDFKKCISIPLFLVFAFFFVN